MKIGKTLTLIYIFSILILSIPTLSFAEIPKMINYQGKLTDTAGNPIDGARSITFNIYDQQAGGAPIWTETQAVSITKGIFTTQIGATKDLNLSFDRPYYLGIKIGTDAEMSPRSALSSSAYSFYSKTAENAVEANIIKGIDRSGLQIHNTIGNPYTSVNIKANSLNINGVIKTAIDLNVVITTQGLNGLDAGSESASKWYYMWIIYNTSNDTIGGLLSASPISPVTPAGYTKKRLVGAVRNDASGNFIKFYQYDNDVFYDEYINALSVGNAGWTDLDLSYCIPAISQIARLQVRQWGGGAPGSESMGIQFRPNGSSSANGQVYIRLYQGYQTTITEVSLDSNQVIEYKASDSRSGGGISLNQVDVVGFTLTGI